VSEDFAIPLIEITRLMTFVCDDLKPLLKTYINPTIEQKIARKFQNDQQILNYQTHAAKYEKDLTENLKLLREQLIFDSNSVRNLFQSQQAYLKSERDKLFDRIRGIEYMMARGANVGSYSLICRLEDRPEELDDMLRQDREPKTRIKETNKVVEKIVRSRYFGSRRLRPTDYIDEGYDLFWSLRPCLIEIDEFWPSEPSSEIQSLRARHFGIRQTHSIFNQWGNDCSEVNPLLPLDIVGHPQET
jgi:hypothetical protein